MTPATMDFFESQENARSKTVLLTAYFFLAILFIIVGIYIAIFIAWTRYDKSVTSFWHPELFIWTALGVIIIVLIGSISKILTLSKGGESVAQMLGAVPVDPNTQNPNERRLLNVVDEMAIASGVPVPQVFLLQNEDGINAFAAGFTPGNAIIAVTRGCMIRLTRDELQGVVAHEFSHILNGDMRLNIQLMGIIAGILIIGIMGRAIVGGTSSKSSSGKKGGGASIIVIIGLIIMAVGYIGVFFGKLIKSAVSRQREYLADASAVQFTRNPIGIAGALQKIGNIKTGSRISNAHAEEASHLFFGNGLGKPFLKLLSTHPPIEERIRRIDPSFILNEYKPGRKKEKIYQAPLAADISPLVSLSDSLSQESTAVHLSPDQLTSMVGSPKAEHLVFASQLVSDLSPIVAETVREPFGARALVYCLLFNREDETRNNQMERLNKYADSAVMREVRMLMPIIDTLGIGYRLPLVDLAIPTLKLLSENQYKSFRGNVKHLIESDRKIDIFEYTLHCMIIHHLDPAFEKRLLTPVKYHVVYQVQVESFTLLSILAWQGSTETVVAETSFKRGITELGIGKGASILDREKCGLKGLDASLDRLAAASPKIKEKILKGCIACISADSLIRVEEAEMLRAIADSLDCPIPPVFPNREKL